MSVSTANVTDGGLGIGAVLDTTLEFAARVSEARRIHLTEKQRDILQNTVAKLESEPYLAARLIQANLALVNESALRVFSRFLFPEPDVAPGSLDHLQAILLVLFRDKAKQGIKVALDGLEQFAETAEPGELAELAKACMEDALPQYVEAIKPRLRWSRLVSGLIAGVSLVAGVFLGISHGLQGAFFAGVFLFGSLGVCLSCVSQLGHIYSYEVERGQEPTAKSE
jgi:hypothetical protein